jgi:hypothetical protein
VGGNELPAEGRVVHASYGCGAHSDTSLPLGAVPPAFDAYDDGAVEMSTTSAVAGAGTEDSDSVSTE